MLANTLIVVFWVFKQKQKIFIHMVDIKKLQKGLKQFFLLWVIISICLLVGFTQIHRITFIEVCSTWRTGLAQSPGHNIVTGKKKKKKRHIVFQKSPFVSQQSTGGARFLGPWSPVCMTVAGQLLGIFELSAMHCPLHSTEHLVILKCHVVKSGTEICMG